MLKEAFKVNPLGCIQIHFTRLHLNTNMSESLLNEPFNTSIQHREYTFGECILNTDGLTFRNDCKHFDEASQCMNPKSFRSEGAKWKGGRKS